MSNNNDTFSKTMLVVMSTCLVCALVVSVAAVSLRPAQQEQRALDKQRNILAAAGIAADEGKIPEVYHKYIEARVIDLATGDYVTEFAGETIDAESFDQRKAAKLPKFAETIAVEDDVAGVRTISRLASVYIAHNDQGAVTAYVVPVHGQGLWSTMYAFLAVEPDGVTAKSLIYYDQGETPGLGGEVVNPLWIAQWDGKKLFDESGKPALQVIKGTADPAGADYLHQVDGLAGATLTTKGVNNTFVFWLSDNGLGPFFAKLRQGGQDNG